MFLRDGQHWELARLPLKMVAAEKETASDMEAMGAAGRGWLGEQT